MIEHIAHSETMDILHHPHAPAAPAVGGSWLLLLLTTGRGRCRSLSMLVKRRR